MRRRAVCYVTRSGADGPELLVFRQDDAAAGIQTPGGTIEPGETPLVAALREAAEETGLACLAAQQLLRLELFERAGETAQYYHVHIRTTEPTVQRWSHTVSAGTTDAGMVFHFFWMPFAEAGSTVWPHMVSALPDIVTA